MIELENYNNSFIKIIGITDLVEFVQKSQQVEGEIFVRRGHYCVSGSSLMGMMSIDVSQGVTVWYPTDATAFEQYISKFEV